MHKVAIYRRYAYQSPNHRPRWSFVLTNFKTIQHVNKHEIVSHNLKSPVRNLKLYMTLADNYNH